MNLYNQEVKETSRKLIWKNAINTVTNNREESRILKNEHMIELWNHASKKLGEIKGYKTDTSYLNDWMAYSDTIYRRKNVSEIRVAYLCGPNPQNDLDIITGVNTALKFPKNAGIKFLTFIQSQEVKLDEFQLFSFPPYGTNRL